LKSGAGQPNNKDAPADEKKPKSQDDESNDNVADEHPKRQSDYQMGELKSQVDEPDNEFADKNHERQTVCQGDNLENEDDKLDKEVA
jgi:hypothetical protein